MGTQQCDELLVIQQQLTELIGIANRHPDRTDAIRSGALPDLRRAVQELHASVAGSTAQEVSRAPATSSRTVNEFKPGDHICFIYETEDEHRAVLTPYMRQGLERNEKLIYVADTHSAQTVLGYLRETDLDIDPYLKTGQLVILSPEDTYLRDNIFVPDRMIALLRSETDRALAEGYSALRATGEMSWARHGLPGSERLMEYEAKLNEFFTGSQCLAVCQYDQRQFEPSFLLEVLRTHPIAIIGSKIFGNHHYAPPSELLSDGDPAATFNRWVDGLDACDRVQQTLNASESIFRTLVETIPHGIEKIDTSGTIIFANEALCEIHGYPHGELIGRKIWDFEADEPKKLAAYLELLVRDQPQPTPYIGTYRTKAGRLKTTQVDWDYTRDAANQVTGFVSIITDITDRKHADEALRSSEERFRQLAENIREVFWLYDLNNSKVIYVSPAYERIWGRTAEDIYRNPEDWMNTIVPEDRRDVLKSRNLLRQGTDFDEEYRIVPASGSIRWIRDRGFPILDDNGNVVRLAGIAEDITERKKVEESLRESNLVMTDALERERQAAAKLEKVVKQLETAKRKAEDATQSKSEFLANMSHEIRTPMTAILGYAEAMLDDDLSESERADSIHTIRRNGEHLLEIINDILDISKIEAGKMEVECIRFSPVRIVGEVGALMRVRADAKNLDLQVEHVGALPETIEGDPTRLKQILVNLVGNAIKFTETGGVKLITRLIERETDPKIQFEIIDTGIGLTKAQARRLFKAFSQADSSTTRTFGGTGLGLMISKRLSEMLGGDVTVTSEPRKGCTFRVTIPTGPLQSVTMQRDVPASASIRREPSAEATPLAKTLSCRVLLAEDGLDNQRLINRMLEQAGAEITVVENGKLAVDAAITARDEDRPFRVILMDMQMPVMDGYEATALLRQKGYTGSIIALTAHAMVGERKKCLEAGCDDFKAKPFTRESLVSAVAEWA